MKTILCRTLAGDLIEWVVIGNDYIDPEINEGCVCYGTPLSELSNPVALQSRISDIQEDIDNYSDIISMTEAHEAVQFLEKWLEKILKK